MKNYKNKEINRLILDLVSSNVMKKGASTKYAFKTQPKINPIN